MPFQTLNGDVTDTFTDLQENLHQQLHPSRKVVNAFMADAQINDSAQNGAGDYQNTDNASAGTPVTIDNIVYPEKPPVNGRNAVAGVTGNTMSMAVDSKL